MSSSSTRRLVIASALFSGFLVGGNLRESLVSRPAWQHVGVLTWAAFSRHADLGTGQIFFPILGIGGTLLAIAAAVSYGFDRDAPRSAALPIYAGAFLAIVGILTVTQSAPYMLSLKRLGDDPVVLQTAFDGYARWSGIKLWCDVLGYLCTMSAVVAILSPASSVLKGQRVDSR